MRRSTIALLAAMLLGACSAPAAVEHTPALPTSVPTTGIQPTAVPPTLAATAALAPTTIPTASAPLAPTSTPYAPGQAGGPTGWLAVTTSYTSETNINLFPVDAGAVAPVTRSKANDYAPAWSPDATKIAFLSDRDGGPGVYITNTTGSTLKRLALGTRDAPITSVSWSPDGTQLVYDRNCTLETVRVDGEGARTLLAPAEGQDACFTSPGYAPDGRQIVFAATIDVNRSAIFTLETASGTVAQLTEYIAEPGSEQSPAFSPDGTQIGFVSKRSGMAFIYLAAADGSNPRRLTRRDAEEFDPTWSPDGAWIAFSSPVQEQSRIFAVSLSGVVVSLDSDEVQTDPAWAPKELP